nr:hypothetical protein [Tanacetum cinerariifolium]
MPEDMNSQGNQRSPKQPPVKKAWSVHGEILSAMKRSANKFSMFELYEYLLYKEESCVNLQGGNAGGGKNAGVKELDDVFEDDTGIAKCMEEDGIGFVNSNKNKVEIRAEGSKQANEKEMDMDGRKEQNNSNDKIDKDGFTQVQHKKSNVVHEKVLKPNYKPNTQQFKTGHQKCNLNSKGGAKFAFQPKKKTNNNSVSKESKNMPEDMNSQGNQRSPKQPPVK